MSQSLGEWLGLRVDRPEILWEGDGGSTVLTQKMKRPFNSAPGLIGKNQPTWAVLCKG